MFSRFLRNLIWAHRGFLAWGIVFLVLIAAWCLLRFRSISEYVDSYRARNGARDANEVLRQDIERLERQHEELARGGFEVEKEARERLDLVKPGEYVLQIDSPPPIDDEVSSPPIDHKASPPLVGDKVTSRPR